MQKVGSVLLITALLFAASNGITTAQAQEIVDVVPAANDQRVDANTSIAGEFETATGTEVDLNSVRIFVNNEEVTDRSTITENFFSYRPSQSFVPGSVRVEVRYRNTRGEQFSKAWSFVVAPRQATIRLDSVSHNAVGRTANTGFEFTVTLAGTPGADASVLLVQDGRTVRELDAEETRPGTYVATQTVRRGDRVSEGVVVGRLQKNGETVYTAASQPFAFGTTTSEPPTSTPTSPDPDSSSPDTTSDQLRPRFTSHEDGDSVGSSGFTLVGRTLPNATVDVRVTSAFSLLDVVRLGEETVVDEDVRANSNGEFRITVPRATIPVPGTQYTVIATARKDGETSSETRLTLTQN